LRKTLRSLREMVPAKAAKNKTRKGREGKTYQKSNLQSPQLSDYDYALPEDKIAIHPLKERDLAKMLVYDANQNLIHSQFSKIGDYLPQSSLLVLNDTRVIHARLLFRKESGSKIEVFCLHPISPFTEINLAMQEASPQPSPEGEGEYTWQCMAGNQRKWKVDETLEMPLNNGGILRATLVEKMGRAVIVNFSWSPSELSFAAVLEMAGKMPLPPYIHREAEAEDETEYQTVFAKNDGAVAAPTAGLHFTETLLNDLRTNGIETEYVTLHVGSGTFQPVEHENVLEHPMHREQVMFSKKLIDKILSGKYKITATGTTVLRALESLYWFGNELETNPETSDFFIEKLQPYQSSSQIPLQKSMQNISNWMDQRSIDTLHGETEIFIFPPYKFMVCNALITNFHLPKSTLLMLVSAFIGDDWKRIYEVALENDYRFLSYGDGMLLIRSQG